MSELCEGIDARVSSFLERPIEGEWSYLWLDATDLKVRENGRILSVAAMNATGVNTDGLPRWDPSSGSASVRRKPPCSGREFDAALRDIAPDGNFAELFAGLDRMRTIPRWTFNDVVAETEFTMDRGHKAASAPG